MADTEVQPGESAEEGQESSAITRAIDTSLLILFLILDTTLDFILWWRQSKLAVKPTKRKYFRPELKRELGVEQDRRCMYCGERKLLKNLQIDHKHPVDRSGSNDRSNLQLLCGPCNQRKGIHTDEEFRARYRRLLEPGIGGRMPKPPSKVISQNLFKAVTKPESTDGRREDSRRGVRELQARWPGLHWGRWEGGGRSSVAAQGPYGRLRGLRCAGW